MIKKNWIYILAGIGGVMIFASLFVGGGKVWELLSFDFLLRPTPIWFIWLLIIIIATGVGSRTPVPKMTLERIFYFLFFIVGTAFQSVFIGGTGCVHVRGSVNTYCYNLAHTLIRPEWLDLQLFVYGAWLIILAGIIGLIMPSLQKVILKKAE